MLELWNGSFSKLTLFERCPKAYYYKYIAGIEYTTPAMELGKRIHEGIARFITTGEYNEELNPYLNSRVRQLQPQPVELVERKFKFNLDGIVMDGVIDIIVEKERKIIDWKTSWQKTADPRQLYLYYHFTKKEGFDINNVAFHYLRFNEEKDLKLDEKQIQETLDWAKKTMEEISEKEFLFTTSEDINEFTPTENTQNCLKCPYKTVCNNVKDVEDITELAKQIEELEAQLELKKEMLKQYIDENGEVKTDNSIWKLTTVNSYDFDIKKVSDYIKSLGKDPLQYLNVTLTSLKKLKLTDEQLEKLGTKKISLRLTNSKLEAS
ncbi:RecB family exonuclease [Caldicellulosiruptoraceae bacterium PP1]